MSLNPDDAEALKRIGDLLYMIEDELMSTRDGKPPSPKHVLEDLLRKCEGARVRLAYVTGVLP
jgi:hypothetical protein